MKIYDYHKVNLSKLRINNALYGQVGKFKDTGSRNAYVSYKDNQLIIKSPVVKIPFGIEKTFGKPKVTLEINSKSGFLKFIKDIENKVIEKFNMESFSGEFKHGVKIGYRNHQPLLTGVKIMYRHKRYETEFLKNSDLATSDDIKKNTKGRFILELNNIWFTDGSYGVLWEAKTIDIIEE